MTLSALFWYKNVRWKIINHQESEATIKRTASEARKLKRGCQTSRHREVPKENNFLSVTRSMKHGGRAVRKPASERIATNTKEL